MFTVHCQKELRAAQRYFRMHLAQGDYHSEGRAIAGRWFGKGVERLGLDPNAPVAMEAFYRLCKNRHPLTDEPLTVRLRRKHRRIYYDFACSAVKSVSIQALTVGDPRLAPLHAESCLMAMQELERRANARVRKGGEDGERTTGELVVAMFQHTESRALDPQLHTHFVVFNATWDPVEHRWKALDPSAMYEQIHLFTEIYRSELARRLLPLGYALRRTANGFELAEVPPELIQRFSKRQRTIAEAEARVAASEGRPLSNNERAAVVRANRPAKRHDLSPEDLRAHQRAQMSAGELATLERLATGVPGVLPPPEPEVARAAIDFARDHLFERNSVVPRHALVKEALRYGLGAFDLATVEAELSRRPEFIAVGQALTTREGLLQEQRLVAFVNQGLGGCRPLHPGFAGGQHLNPEQQQALKFMLGSPDEVMVLRGRAGTGKTALLKEVVRGLEERYRTVVLAPMAAAVEVLRAQGFSHAATVQRFLADPEFQRASAGKALIVDEAGLLSLRDLLALVEATRTLRCRLLLSGDTRQHSGVEAGDALRLLEEQSQLRPVELRSIQRQVNREYREAIAALAQGEGTEGLRRLERLGAVVQLEGKARHQQLARDYAASLRAGKSALIVSPTWRESEQVTEAVRTELQREGLLGPAETQVHSQAGLKWTRAQKQELGLYEEGMLLTFHKDTRDFRRGERGEVTAVLAGRLAVRKPDGREVSVTRKQAACFEVARPLTLAVATGERLLIQGNRKAERLFNGQLATVAAVEPDGGLRLSDGRRVPPDFRELTYGYCITSHAAQGRTVDHVAVAVDAKTVQAANLKQFYVSASRGREQVRIYTDDREFLARAVAKPGHRLTATELVASSRRAEQLKRAPRQAPRLKVGH